MNEKIIIIEGDGIKNKDKKINSINFLSKIFILLYSIILFINTKEILIIISGIALFVLILIITKYISKIIKKGFKIDDDFSAKLLYTEIKYHPDEYAELISDLLSTTILSLFFNLILFILTSILIEINIINLILFIYFSFLPAIFLIYYFLLPYFKENKYNSEIDKEIPIAMMIMTAFSASNINPYTALENISNSFFLKAFKKIFKQIEKLRFFLMLNPVDAIANFSKITSHEPLKKFLQTISAVSLGSSVHSLLKEQMKDTFRIFEKKIEEFIEKFNIILAAQLLVFVLIPIASLMMMVFTQGSMSSMLFSLYIFPTTFFFLFYVMIQALKPTFLKMEFKSSYKEILLISFPFFYFLLNFLGIITVSLAFLLSLSSILLTYYLLNRKKSKELEMLLNELPTIVADIAEEIKKGKGLYQAIEALTDRYEKARSLLKRILFLKKLGFSIEEVLKKEKLPLFFSQTLIALDEIEKVGLDPSTIKDFAEFTNRLDGIRKIFKLRIRFFKLSSLLITALLGFSLGITLSVIGNLISVFKTIGELAYTGYSLNFFNVSITVEELKETVYIAGFLNSALLGFLGGYTDSNSVEGAKNALLCLIVLIAALYSTSFLGFLMFK